MAPSAIPFEQEGRVEVKKTFQSDRKPLTSSGSLDRYESIDITPVIGTEYPQANLVEWINAPDAEERLRDLAIKISERGVVFFRAQDDLTNDLQKQLIQRLGELTGKPASSTLHIHPVLNNDREFGGDDPEISTISSKQHDKLYKNTVYDQNKKFRAARSGTLPRTGGDTLWASGYDIYDRLSEPYQKFLESLTATFSQPGFIEVAKKGGFQLYEQPRGSPENVGGELTAIHPVVRTNPVTGWKSVFPVGGHVKHINGLTDQESKRLLEWFLDLVYKNHELQVRFKWKNPNDLAIWDNRSVFHSATYDYQGEGDRFGNRAVGIGERPFLDPNSTSRRKALGLPL